MSFPNMSQEILAQSRANCELEQKLAPAIDKSQETPQYTVIEPKKPKLILAESLKENVRKDNPDYLPTAKTADNFSNEAAATSSSAATESPKLTEIITSPGKISIRKSTGLTEKNS